MLAELKTNPLWLIGPECGHTLHSVETATGLIEVKESAGLRWLHFDNGAVETVMSLDDPPRLVLDYARAMMVVLVFNPQPRALLNFGLGGGAILRFFSKHLPATKHRTVETNQSVIDLCHTYFNIECALDEIFLCDAGTFLEQQAYNTTREKSDIVFVDLFAKGGIADCLFKPSFYPHLHSMLSKDGIAVFNVIVSDEKELETIFRYIWQAFNGHVVCFTLSDCNNILVLGFESASADLKLQRLYQNASELSKHTKMNLRDYIDLLVKCNGIKNGSLQFMN